MWCDVMWCDVIWCNVMWCDVRVMWCDGTSIHAMSLISHEIRWWDISVVQVSMLCQWYLTKLVGEIFLWYKYPCYVNDISQNRLVRYFFGTSIHATSMISREISWWDFFVVQVSLLCQWYLTKLFGEIFLGTNDACDTSKSVIDVFWGSSKSRDSSDSSNSSDSGDSS